MSKDAELLFEAVLKLAEKDRAELAARLIDSLDCDFADEDVAASWHAEIDRRVASVDSGASDTVPWPEAWRQMMTDENGQT